MSRTRKTENPPCLIAVDLWKVWLANKRKGDVVRIMELAKKANLPCSKPVVNKAIDYGFVHDSALRDLVTKYFADRYAEERGQAEQLRKLLREKH